VLTTGTQASWAFGMSLILPIVNRSVAVGTKCNEIALRIAPQLASALNVVDLEAAQGTASLATPAIPFENLPLQPVVGVGIQPNPARFC
jgi:hypothetical protein